MEFQICHTSSRKNGWISEAHKVSALCGKGNLFACLQLLFIASKIKRKWKNRWPSDSRDINIDLQAICYRPKHISRLMVIYIPITDKRQMVWHPYREQLYPVPFSLYRRDMSWRRLISIMDLMLVKDFVQYFRIKT